MPTRRGFLTSLLAASTLPALSWADAGSPAYLGAAKGASGRFSLIGLGADASRRFAVPLPGRGHAAAAHPSAPEAVAFARRPGTFALVIDCAAGHVAHRLEAPEGRHFYGHGAFVAGGTILCTTENDMGSGAGRIGLWSRPDGYRRIGEVATHGIGPHDLLRLSGDVLAVANGGIRTHPDTGREKLNLDTMAPSLSYLTPEGELLDQVTLDPELHKNSIRHLAAAADGTVAFAMQWQGEAMAPVPLLGLHRRGSAPRLLAADDGEQIAMQGYAGSVAISWDGARVGITSPRGGRLHVFGRADGACTILRRPDICGLAPSADGFTATDGMGGVLRVTDRLAPLAADPGTAWDNHLIAIG
ncbi:DUF1513 domain-containing protein [Roseivivax sediminis]|uniref:Twin-arginine translocation pathway signal n=1 Tax=Roseivivax sediminis TaxID=936889 RepID=A0A1I1ZD10_9RHOB|nr:DUF1513 domain-containing protein [Roseivivax sediminis]SFE29597.1 hypothetical protein SAMN04515678_10897 [Roseivivax sediminis]